MRRLARILALVILGLTLSTVASACEPCADPSQLWCPDQW